MGDNTVSHHVNRVARYFLACQIVVLQVSIQPLQFVWAETGALGINEAHGEFTLQRKRSGSYDESVALSRACGVRDGGWISGGARHKSRSWI